MMLTVKTGMQEMRRVMRQIPLAKGGLLLPDHWPQPRLLSNRTGRPSKRSLLDRLSQLLLQLWRPRLDDRQSSGTEAPRTLMHPTQKTTALSEGACAEPLIPCLKHHLRMNFLHLGLLPRYLAARGAPRVKPQRRKHQQRPAGLPARDTAVEGVAGHRGLPKQFFLQKRGPTF